MIQGNVNLTTIDWSETVSHEHDLRLNLYPYVSDLKALSTRPLLPLSVVSG